VASGNPGHVSRVRATLLVIAVCGLLSGPAVGTTAAQAGDSPSPTLTVTAAGGTVQESTPAHPVPDGGERTVEAPATVGVEAEASAPIDLVVVRVDGETYRSISPNDTTVSRTIALDVGSGAHDIRTVVRVDNQTVNHRMTLRIDGGGPRINFEEPLAPDADGLPQEITVSQSTLRVAGSITDTSTVERLEIERRSFYVVAGDVEFNRSRTVLTDPNRSFARTLRLFPTESALFPAESEAIPPSPTGDAVNRIKITVSDRFGQIRVYEFNVRVSDDTPPDVTITSLRLLYSRSDVRIGFAVTDDVGIRSVSVSGAPNLLLAASPEEQPRRRAFTHTVSLEGRTETVEISATDRSGDTTTIQRKFDRTELITPQLSFNTSKTNVVAPQTVRAVATVSQGAIARVRAETVAPDGTVIDIKTAHSGGIVNSVRVNTTLEMPVTPARVRLRVVDVTGTEHVVSTLITTGFEGEQTETTAERTPRTAATTTATPTRTPPPADRTSGVSTRGSLVDYGLVASVLTLAVAVIVFLRR
jgi:hypothetical protein